VLDTKENFSEHPKNTVKTTEKSVSFLETHGWVRGYWCIPSIIAAFFN
jgi:hypothetical protein